MDAKGGVRFPWLHFLNEGGWLAEVGALPQGESRRTDKGEREVGQRAPREGAEGKVPSRRRRLKDTDPEKMQAQQQLEEKRGIAAASEAAMQ